LSSGESNSDSEDDAESGSDSDGFVKMNFKDRKTKKTKNEEKGVMGLKFMKKAEEKQKEALKAEASMAID
jgi:U3 small nucleolar RNA-associated protein 14